MFQKKNYINLIGGTVPSFPLEDPNKVEDKSHQYLLMTGCYIFLIFVVCLVLTIMQGKCPEDEKKRVGSSKGCSKGEFSFKVLFNPRGPGNIYFWTTIIMSWICCCSIGIGIHGLVSGGKKPTTQIYGTLD